MGARNRTRIAPTTTVALRRPKPVSLGLALASLLLANAARADLLTCLNETGYAFIGGRSGLVLWGSDPVWLFDPDGGYELVFCAPPHEGMLGISSPSGSVVVEYLAGTGLALATGALATSAATQFNRMYVDTTLVFEFRVIPNDPQATDPVEIDIVARHEFDEVRADVSGVGDVANSHEGAYWVNSFSPNGPRIGSIWLGQGIIPSTGAVFNVLNTLAVPVNTNLYYFANARQQSVARGGLSGQQGSGGAADQSSAVTFEITTEADATIEFALVERLGIPPPMLGVVAVPEAGGGLAAALATLAALGRRSARRATPGPASATAPRCDARDRRSRLDRDGTDVDPG
jgi:hypothetical protein